MISRRSLFGFLAAAPFGAVAAVKAVAEAVPVDPPMIAVGDSFVDYGRRYWHCAGMDWTPGPDGVLIPATENVRCVYAPDLDERIGEVLRPIDLRMDAIRETMQQQSCRPYWRS